MDEEEIILVHYIEYMSTRGFPIKAYAWAIGKKRQGGKGDPFGASGPSNNWCKGFKKRHPDLKKRIPDNLDRARAPREDIISDFFQ